VTGNASSRGHDPRSAEGWPRRCPIARNATRPEGEAVRGRTRLRFRRAGGAFILLAFLASITVAACSSPAENSGLKLPTRSTTDPTAAVQAAVLAAWKAAETAFYQAEANPTGLFSPSLDSTMVNPELQLVKSNLDGWCSPTRRWMRLPSTPRVRRASPPQPLTRSSPPIRRPLRILLDTQSLARVSPPLSTPLSSCPAVLSVCRCRAPRASPGSRCSLCRDRRHSRLGRRRRSTSIDRSPRRERQ